MARVPRISDNGGHDTSWTTANRPTNPDHGMVGLNETTGELEWWDAIGECWRTTAGSTVFYPS